VYIHALYEKGNEKRGTWEVLLKWTDNIKKKKNFLILFSGTAFTQTNHVFILQTPSTLKTVSFPIAKQL